MTFCCLLSRAYTVIFLRKRMFCVTLLKTKIHLINLNKSSTSHFTKVSLHDFTDLHMKLAFYGGTKEHWAEWGAIIVLSQLLYFHNRWRTEFRLLAQPYGQVWFSLCVGCSIGFDRSSRLITDILNRYICLVWKCELRITSALKKKITLFNLF